jgi:hypothetical protein
MDALEIDLARSSEGAIPEKQERKKGRSEGGREGGRRRMRVKFNRVVARKE